MCFHCSPTSHGKCYFASFVCYSNNSTSYYIGKPILLLKEITRCIYYNVKTISSMEIIFYCSESLWFMELLNEFQGKDEMMYLFYFLSSLIFFDCINVRLVVKLFPCFVTLEVTLLYLCLLNSSLTVHHVYWAC